MFRSLRLRLTLLYLFAALALIILLVAGTYRLVDNYFQSTTDLGLQHMMAHELRGRGVTDVPPELAAADRDWAAGRAQLFPGLDPDTAAAASQAAAARPPGRGSDGDGRAAGPPPGPDRDQDMFDGELAAIFVLPLDASGHIEGAAPPAAPLAPDEQAVAAALAVGHDARTIQLATGARVRLLTYRAPAPAPCAVLQLGRTLADKDQVLHELLISLLGLGGLSAVLLGFGSWGLAGRALRPAQDAWTRQQTFVANASHELRTPLTLMRASAEVVRRGLPPDAADSRALLDDVLHETDHMNRLVEDLLLLSRLDAGRLPFQRQVIPLAAMLDEVQRQVARMAAERGVALDVAAAPGAVWGDPTRLRQVLLILLDNALRYTPAGGHIRLMTRVQGHAVQIGVADTGSGIALEHQAHVFERFYRAESTPAQTPGGTGLGLAIARGLVEAQQGHIALQSRPGAGTEVTVTLPLAPAAPSA